VVGVMFLGTPRDPRALHARESAPGLVLPLCALAALCIAIGLVPVVVLPPMLRVGAFLASVPPSSSLLSQPAAWPLTIFALMLGAGIPLSVLLFAAWSREHPRARAATWGCGYPATTARMQYTASSFAAPVLLSFGPVAAVRVTRTMDAFATHAVDPVMDGAVRYWQRMRAVANRLRPIHRGRLSLSLLYVVATLIALLFYLLFAGHAP